MASWKMAKTMSRLLGKWYWRFPLLMPQRSAMRLAETVAVPSALKSSRAACRMRSCVTFVAMAPPHNWLTPKAKATLARRQLLRERQTLFVGQRRLLQPRHHRRPIGSGGERIDAGEQRRETLPPAL